MLEILYQEELARQKDLAAEFAEAHPALAPMLGGAAADPDVERLFQGVALQFAQLRQKLEDDVPEFTHALARQLCPQLLRPVPATTIVAFAPKASLAGSRIIEAGTELDSVPVEGTSCRFRICADVELHPLELLDASLTQLPGAAPAISLSFALAGISLDSWKPHAVRLFLAEDYPLAADLFFVLSRRVRRVLIAPEGGGAALELRPDSLVPACLNESEGMLPYPAGAFPGYRLLQEFFALPNRFLFLDITGWESWRNRGSGSRFTISFELLSFPASLRVRTESFALFATPAVNLFACDAAPFVLDHRRECYPVRPDGVARGHAQIFAVERVKGFGHGTGRRRNYRPVEELAVDSDAEPSFGTTAALAPLGGELQVSLSFNHAPDGLWLEGETISVALACTNGRLPELLSLGDVCRATSTSPEWASFRNIIPVRPGALPCLGKNLLWRLVAHQSLNLGSLLEAEALRELLGIYLFEEPGGGRSLRAAHRKRIAGIEEVTASARDLVLRGAPIRGTEIDIRINGSHFAGVGDLFVFGAVLDSLLAGLAALNSYTRLTIHDTTTGEALAWKPRLGDQALL
ncbi:type VI secretion system protein ImpG [Geomonas silvestris]|uniref:Type VI secretion system protein ImpG n=1 Tax=Geomonas silvestris TaxID=2740184 RepID=A0A6V8MKT1_9BACT|nr:type VI secretion system baseplate subunit TssF [Geomonas silvestris]GFO60544.1 type VI secretion system protein ImpG [Geomonas silvestris]